MANTAINNRYLLASQAGEPISQSLMLLFQLGIGLLKALNLQARFLKIGFQSCSLLRHAVHCMIHLWNGEFQAFNGDHARPLLSDACQ